MKTELIFELARKAKIKNDCDGIWCTADQLVRFAKKIAVYEREECAKMAEAFHRHGYDFTGDAELHEAIRSRT